MPLYSFKCHKCKKKFEQIVKDRDEMVVCECNYIAKRKFPNTFNFKLKGSGWFIDGYSKEKKQEN